ncbi:MAG TPA: hypothetical protein GX515_00180 [Firmicutes bacterium]|nr:hypothetical protein [Bacillota bacterium]
MLYVGAAKTEITPAPRIPMAGYRARVGVAKGVHDPLFARAVTLDDGGRGLVLVALDLLAAGEDLVAAIRRETMSRLRGMPAGGADVIVCATHTHAGPAGILSNSENHDRELVGAIVCKAAEAAAVAWETRRLGRIGFGSCRIQGVACNRADSSSSFDPLLRLMKLEDVSGSPIACVINYGCHPTVLGPENLLFSRDWPGYTQDMMEASRDPIGMVLFLNGASADVSTRYTRRASSFDEAQRLGRIVADGALGAARQIEYVPTHEIRVLRKRVTLPRKPPVSPESASQALREAEEELAELKARADASPAEVRRAESAVLAWQIVVERSRDPRRKKEGLEASEPVARPDPVVPVSPANFAEREGVKLVESACEGLTCEVCVLDLESAIMAFVPGEATARTGSRVTQRIAEIRGLATDRVWLIGYANGHLGYIADTDEARGADPSSYEALMSRVTPEAARLIEEEIANLVVKGMSDRC